MSWNPTHVQLTVLRAKNLLKNKGGSKLTDVFVAIVLGKEKFQTSTIKNAVNPEWFEQCDLSINSMQSSIQITVLHRGILTDEFIGYASVPLADYKIHDRPQSQWLKLQGRPNKPPSNKNRGELEVKLTFQVKVKTEEPTSPTKKQAPIFKSLASAMGDKFKRSKSFRENQPFDPVRKRHGTAGNEKSKMFSSKSLSASLGKVNFPAIDKISGPLDWLNTREEHKNPAMGRSASMVLEKFKEIEEAEDQANYNRYNKPGNRQSLPPSYWGTQTLPHPRGKKFELNDSDGAIHVTCKSAEDLDTSVSSQPGYLENMFKKEVEVYNSMKKYDSSSEENLRYAKVKTEPVTKIPDLKQAKEFHSEEESDSNSDKCQDVTLPKERQQNAENRVSNVSGDDGSRETKSKGVPEKKKEVATDYSVMETSFPEFSLEPVSHTVKQDFGKSKEQKIEETKPCVVNGVSNKMPVPPERRRKISPKQNFNFDNSPEKPLENPMVKRRSKSTRDRLSQLYKQGGRRYTVQGLDLPPRPQSMSADDLLLGQRPQMNNTIGLLPEDLISVYRSMNKEELIRLVITHKAQLIRKDQYIKDMEDYIDNLLVRVMESSPRLLQQNQRFK